MGLGKGASGSSLTSRYCLTSESAAGQLNVGKMPAPSAEWSLCRFEPEGPTSGHSRVIVGSGKFENAVLVLKRRASRPFALANSRLRPYSMYFNWSRC